MPIHKVPGGYKWGNHGKVYKTRAGAERQMRAAFSNGYRGQGHKDGGVVTDGKKEKRFKEPLKEAKEAASPSRPKKRNSKRPKNS